MRLIGLLRTIYRFFAVIATVAVSERAPRAATVQGTGGVRSGGGAFRRACTCWRAGA
jgi:hypothetical protein